MQRHLILIFLLFTTAGFKLSAQKMENVLVYIETYKDFAISEMKRTGIPAAIKLAQGIHETEAGTSDLVRRSNNHFGIKCKTTWTGDKVFHDDDARGECFRSYTKSEDSYIDHSNFLKNSPRYGFLFELDPTDYEGWAYGLKKAGYATNIRYSQVLIKIINEYHLQDYTLIAMGAMKESDRALAMNNQGLHASPVSSQIIKEESLQEIVVQPSYPTGEFRINNTRVIYAQPNTSWLSIAEQYNIPLAHLWDFNDLESDDDIIAQGQLVYLQRKRKVGGSEYHTLKSGESLYDVCQAEGIRLESLLTLNYLKSDMQPLAGEKLSLQYLAFDRPALATKNQKKLPYTNATETRISPATPQANDVSSSHAAAFRIPDTAPTITTHFVSTKETLYSISKKYGVDPEKIKIWNSLDNINVKTGQELIIYRNN